MENLMQRLVQIRDKIKAVFDEYQIYFLLVLKFALAMILFVGLSRMMGYFSILNNIFVIVVLSLFCAILPLNGTIVLGFIAIILHCYGIGLEVGLFAAVLYLVMLALYFRFVPADGLALLLTPLMCTAGMPLVVPLGLGLMRKPVSAFAGVFSVISWYFLKMQADISLLRESLSAKTKTLEVLKKMVSGLLNNKEMWIMVLTWAAVILITATIRKLVRVYSWVIAMAVGVAVYLVISVAGSTFLDVDMNYGSLFLGVLGAAAVSFVIGFFVYSVDYKQSQYLQFEDDEYYYYVKAIPKIRSTEEIPEAEEEE